ncbi:hypothetical protein Pst134EA_002914 [Puccinia striiformis f. sp. tritici]|uniref:hypothetical protein n=1 Tax=Puccinia striiformis f. sp. tritici TaxID=168172 RepID=UPI002008D3D6|nr:hypothetical protein Pst134EA_002914 [Puccinia striiformis f. sp. tritici]KAH9464465.1 hypothetical protein Pst134EB_004000 [Puccinia striiformis f. sp. tritici]KAH9472291.1 hypothetical protein Pst134EA_002914 [Puccinia striiformis f. sp. tritici]
MGNENLLLSRSRSTVIQILSQRGILAHEVSLLLVLLPSPLRSSWAADCNSSNRTILSSPSQPSNWELSGLILTAVIRTAYEDLKQIAHLSLQRR